MAINLNILEWKLFEVAEKYMERSKYAYILCLYFIGGNLHLAVLSAYKYCDPPRPYDLERLLSCPSGESGEVDLEHTLLASGGRGV